MRTVLSEEAVAAMGRIGCGEVIQERVVEGGESEARGLMMRGRWVGLGEGMMSAGVLRLLGTGVILWWGERDRSRVWSAEEIRGSPGQLDGSHYRKYAGALNRTMKLRLL